VCGVVGDESAPQNEPEMTSPTHGRERRSAGEQVAMTAEHMAADDAAKVNRASRLKRDLHDYLYRRRWNTPGIRRIRRRQLRMPAAVPQPIEMGSQPGKNSPKAVGVSVMNFFEPTKRILSFAENTRTPNY